MPAGGRAGDGALSGHDRCRRGQRDPLCGSPRHAFMAIRYKHGAPSSWWCEFRVGGVGMRESVASAGSATPGLKIRTASNVSDALSPYGSLDDGLTNLCSFSVKSIKTKWQSGLVSRFQGETCGNARPHRAQACAPSGGNGLPQPGQCVANRIPQWAQNCQCEAISWRQSRHSWRNWWNSSWSFWWADSSRLSSDGCCCCSSSMVSLPSRIGPLRTAADALASSRKASICIQTGSECCALRRVYTSSAPAFIKCIAIESAPLNRTCTL